MGLDQVRLNAIIDGEHSFYGSQRTEVRVDRRFNPGTRDFLATQVQPNMRVLDVGCGSGGTLLRLSSRIASGLGVDNDPEHIRMADEALRESGAKNVEFRQLDFLEDGGDLEPESFDLAFTERGPIGFGGHGMRLALRALKPNGLLFCEMIGNLHHQEAAALFGTGQPRYRMTRSLDEARVAMERNGVDIRLAAEIVQKRCYPDVYEWLRFQCSIWAWLGVPLPTPDDPRLALFAERNTIDSGEIETTHHVVWVAGVKADHTSGSEIFHHT
ncbi:MAG: methyltransferase domain-containing protein [SAR202 cluster bacterium]|nr:methyltransferase domain-containing protein [SAR202 cluster bacterium]MDP6664518.1 methyltransferase domain-containing protein [SAR202 cluster bacterium]MDP6801494.1 methyltransferase domain-containing protein [SAR202 cluster bacterium]